MTKPTMQDVAHHAGVSLKTVSRVVNREPRVSAEIERRVHASIAALGFHRNEAASRLARRASTMTLGLVVENIGNEFYARLAKSVQDAAFARDALVVFGSYAERPDRERLLVESMYARGVDRLVVVPAPGSHGWLAEYLASGLSAVFIDRVPPGVPAVDAVLLDNAAGGRLATEHLLASGHRRIALVSDAPEIDSVRARGEGYRSALAAAGVAVDESLVVRGLFEPEAVQRAASRLLDGPRPPTAFFATNNRAAVGVVRALQDRSGPGVALVGFDDFTVAGLASPKVTVVRYDCARIGREAVGLLLRRGGGNDPAPRQVTLPVELVPRGSGEIPPSG